MSVGRICGSLLGGILGDWFASRWPLHGRALVGQMSIALGAVPLYWVLRCCPHSGSSYSLLAAALFSFSLLALWCNPGVDRPLWSELVPPDSRSREDHWLVENGGRNLREHLWGASGRISLHGGGIQAQDQGARQRGVLGHSHVGLHHAALGSVLLLLLCHPHHLSQGS